MATIIERLATELAQIITKGGVTSTEVAIRELGVRRAQVLGHALPGVPIWHLDPESRWPRLNCVVFPGNAGSPAEMIRVLRGGDVHALKKRRVRPCSEDSTT